MHLPFSNAFASILQKFSSPGNKKRPNENRGIDEPAYKKSSSHGKLPVPVEEYTPNQNSRREGSGALVNIPKFDWEDMTLPTSSRSQQRWSGPTDQQHPPRFSTLPKPIEQNVTPRPRVTMKHRTQQYNSSVDEYAKNLRKAGYLVPSHPLILTEISPGGTVISTPGDGGGGGGEGIEAAPTPPSLVHRPPGTANRIQPSSIVNDRLQQLKNRISTMPVEIEPFESMLAVEKAEQALRIAEQHRRRTSTYIDKAKMEVMKSQELKAKEHEREVEVDELQRRMNVLQLQRLKKGVKALPPLTSEDRDQYDEVTAADPTTVLVHDHISHIDVKGHDMEKLGPAEWLNDEIINVCVSLMMQRDGRLRGTPKYNYKDVRRWTLPKRLENAGQKSASVLDVDRIIIPVNQNNVHWVCAMIDLKNEKLVYFDSMAGEDRACLESLAKWLRDEYKDKRNEDRPDILQWPREFAKGIPLQANGYDCGVYTLLFAEYSAKGDAFDFDQENIDDFRVRFVRDIMRLKID